MNELTELEKIEQILGKALGYPWYKDDPDIFPKATEADGVCVGVETAWSLAMIAADRIKELENKAMNIEIVSMAPDSDGAKLAQLFAESDINSSLLKENEALIEENMKLRNALSQVATNLRNGSVVSPEASIEFMTVDLPNEVKLVIDQLRKRHPTKEEALAQYQRLKENSTRNVNSTNRV
jgi:hypothetical protein